MMISLIVAMNEDGGIGKMGRLPWRLGADLKRFKRLTIGHHVVMGRKTYESIGSPLPGRTMVVITRNPDYHAEGCFVVGSIEEALALTSARGEDEAFIIGGGEIFAQALPLAQRLYLTQVRTHANCDVFFPSFDPAEWAEVERKEHPADERNEHAFRYTLLQRVGGGDH